MKIKKKAWSILLNVLYALVGAVMLLPIYYLLVTTFKTPAEAAASPLGLPVSFTLSNYQKALGAMDYMRALRNNLIITGCAVILLLIFSSMAAYAIARSKRRVFKWMYSIFMLGLIVPFQVAIIPLYKIISGLHLMNTLPGVILINVFCINLPLSVFLFRGFINTVPKELEEAAYIDGCGTFHTFWLIIFPLLKPIVSTVAILDALAVWNDFMTPLLFLQDPNKGVLLQEVYKNIGPFSTNWTSFFPMLVLATLPLVIFYLIMQRSIIEGVVAGSVKG
ncbi:carbohydrate ABC transporter permease [Hydrogenoanaerobacterium sp.]|uniref:carbohydrate ABC transporter permease n=1 Tax=Hydrogenoanaerobacterium sp. TaxID=2953763 RepID=UPI00289D93B6|nr:carbohydrate ABC transporter permease [Hydrogenoanaerobacterium sp.]